MLTLSKATTFDTDDGFTLKSDGCSIPVMNPFEISINKFVNFPSNLTSCPNNLHPLLGNNQTHIWIKPHSFRHYRINNQSHFNCCYKSFHRPLTFSNIRRADDRIQYLGCIMFQNSIEANNEFVKVTCYNKNRFIYNQFFVFTPKKPFTNNRNNPFTISNETGAYNVIILGLSAMSRLNFHRTMPHTYELLTNLGSIELLGYHTTAENTYKNIIPLLTGMNNREINLTCWPNGRPLFDSCPFIWERFKDVGFYTALLEDTARSGMFNSGMFGFSGTPTDYYLHPFVREAENLMRPFETNNNNRRFRKPMRLHHKTAAKDGTGICMGNKHSFRLILEYIDSLTNLLNTSKLFGLFWESSMSVDPNAPMAMDHGYETLIKKLNNTGYLNKTILLVMSDHGTNFGNIHKTKQGRLEERLPLVSVLMPPSFRDKHRLAYENIKRNSKQITTAFDLHETLIDLVNLESVTDPEIHQRMSDTLIYERGRSLFLPLPNKRTCENAGIKSQWCACHKTYKLNIKSKLVKEASIFIVKHLNRMIEPYRQCKRLNLDMIIEAEEMLPIYKNETEWQDIRVLVKLKPGAEDFEAMLRRDGKGWSLTATIRRLNEHSSQISQDHCMHDTYLKPYCHCR